MGRSLGLQPPEKLNPMYSHISQIWRHRTHHGYHSIVAAVEVREAESRMAFWLFENSYAHRARDARPPEDRSSIRGCLVVMSQTLWG